jgi:hypothetical protein
VTKREKDSGKDIRRAELTDDVFLLLLFILLFYYFKIFIVSHLFFVFSLSSSSRASYPSQTTAAPPLTQQPFSCSLGEREEESGEDLEREERGWW